VVKFLQGSVVTQTVLSGLTICPAAISYNVYIHAKNYEYWLTVDSKVIAMVRRGAVF